jgi:hypothetical protein
VWVCGVCIWCVCVCGCVVCVCGVCVVCVCVCVCVCTSAQGEYFLAQYRISSEQGSKSPSSIKARKFVVVWCLFNCSRRHLGKHLVVIRLLGFIFFRSLFACVCP